VKGDKKTEAEGSVKSNTSAQKRNNEIKNKKTKSNSEGILYPAYFATRESPAILQIIQHNISTTMNSRFNNNKPTKSDINKHKSQ